MRRGLHYFLHNEHRRLALTHFLEMLTFVGMMSWIILHTQCLALGRALISLIPKRIHSDAPRFSQDEDTFFIKNRELAKW